MEAECTGDGELEGTGDTEDEELETVMMALELSSDLCPEGSLGGAGPSSVTAPKSGQFSEPD